MLDEENSSKHERIPRGYDCTITTKDSNVLCGLDPSSDWFPHFHTAYIVRSSVRTVNMPHGVEVTSDLSDATLLINTVVFKLCCFKCSWICPCLSRWFWGNNCSGKQLLLDYLYKHFNFYKFTTQCLVFRIGCFGLLIASFRHCFKFKNISLFCSEHFRMKSSTKWNIQLIWLSLSSLSSSFSYY